MVITAANDDREEEKYVDLLKAMIMTGQRQLFETMRFQLRDYIDGIKDIKWYSKDKLYYFESDEGWIFSTDERFEKYLDEISVEVPPNKVERFLFKLYFATARHIGYGVQYEYISPLLRRAEKLINNFEKVFVENEKDVFDGKRVAVVQLADVNKEMQEIIPSLLAQRFFNKQQDEKQDGSIKNIINVVVDEAHNILYENEKDKKHTSVTIDVFEKAIKEGRKFGLFLWISSQRPSDISSSIISQMHNYFIHKLINPFDLNAIRKSVAFLDQNAMDMLTVLGPGECVASGVSISMPCFIKVEQLSKEKRPNSENVVLFGEDGIFEKEGEKDDRTSNKSNN